MHRKEVATITLAAFVLTSTSCMISRTKSIDGIAGAPGKHAKIMSVVMASGERMDFSNSAPGRVRGRVITGTAVARFSVPVDIPLSDVRQVRFKKINPTLTFIAIAVPVSLGLLYLAMTAAFRE